MQPTDSPYILLKKSKIHGTGVYAKIDIKKGTKIIEYIGEKVSKEEGDRRAEEQETKAKSTGQGMVYVFELNEKEDIDGSPEYNTARYINHSCDPNCDVDITDDHIWIIAIKDIKQGEELCYNYDYDFEDYEEHPCRCGSARCVGYIMSEELWPKLKKDLEKKVHKS